MDRLNAERSGKGLTDFAADRLGRFWLAAVSGDAASLLDFFRAIM